MKWIKRQWKRFKTLIIVAVIGAGSGVVVLNNGKTVEMTPYKGVHLLAPDFGTVYANGGAQITLEPGQRLVQIAMVLDSGRVVKAFADTLDATVRIGIISKFIQRRK